MDDVTLVLTSCCRFDLLEKTVDSFLKYNDYPIHEHILVDDGGDAVQHDKMLSKYGGMFKLIIEGHKGQLASVDRAYGEIKTEFIFHCEDDWGFHKGGFIQKSIDVMKEFDNIGQVWIRRDDNPHKLEKEICHTTNGVEFQYPVSGWEYGKKNSSDGGWFGFSFNPGLRRLSHYRKMAPYAQYGSERHIGWKVRDMGLKTASLMGNYITHLGYNRSTYPTTT